MNEPILHHILWKIFSEICGLFLQIYDENELLQVKLDILSKTNMVDYAIDIRKQLYPNEEVPEVS
jgi:hypothetical protein